MTAPVWLAESTARVRAAHRNLTGAAAGELELRAAVDSAAALLSAAEEWLAEGHKDITTTTT